MLGMRPLTWAVVVALAGWGTWQLLAEPPMEELSIPPTPPSSSQPQAQPVAVAMKGLPRVAPTHIFIKSVWINADIDSIGLTRDWKVETPSYEKAKNAAWYRPGPSPGEVGAAVILGHVDSKKERAVFFELRWVKRGAKIEIKRADGRRVQFRVDSIEQFSKKDFPRERVYAATPRPTLRLVTCGGKFDRTTKRYRDNIVVFASMIPAV